MRTHCTRAVLLAAVSMAAVLCPSAAAQQYRAFWVDMYNSKLNNHTDVVAIVNNAVAANANALFVQVRRRGDSWYRNGLEPLPDTAFGYGPLTPADFDPLSDLIAEAHNRGIEVHAYVIVGAIWDKRPDLAPPTGGSPSDPNHVFNRHGGYNPATKTVVMGPDNWLTRTLVPDVSGQIAFGGYRFVSDFWIDLGHPDAAQFTYEVLMDLVRRYPIDGLHMDRIRYPELGIGGQTPTTGTSIGYNSTSVSRFNRRYGITPANSLPAQNNSAWNQWRRDQVSNFVRRVYLNAVALKPQIKISASTVVFYTISGNNWTATEPYWRVYQDWDSWMQEGILDINAPMNYKREDTSARPMFDAWSAFIKDHQYNRAAIIGQGAYLNFLACSLRQIRRSFEPTTAGNSAAGIIFFSMAHTSYANSSTTAAAPDPCSFTPYSVPKKVGSVNGELPFAEFAAAVMTGKSVSGAVSYEDPAANPVPVFANPALVPQFSWKTNPQAGHLMGIVHDSDGSIVDAGDVAISRVPDGSTPTGGRSSASTATDGNGFYGGVDLAPGEYQVAVMPTGQAAYTYQCTQRVTAGQVTTMDLTIDRNAPTTTLAATPSVLWPPNHDMVTVVLSGSAADVGTGLASVSFRVLDSYATVQPEMELVDGNGAASLDWTRSVQLEATRDGNDREGRVYTIEVTVKDRACNTRSYSVQVVVPHDMRDKN